jgi:hypothetical protein
MSHVQSGREVYHVVPGKGGGWEVRQENARSTGRFTSKHAAIEKAREQAREAPTARVLVHGRDGRIQIEWTYARDLKPLEVQGVRWHVIPLGKTWVVKREGSRRGTRSFRQRDEALEYARALAGGAGGEVILHAADGTIDRWEKISARDAAPRVEYTSKKTSPE